MRVLALVLISVAAGAAQAAVAPSFEQSLGLFRRDFLAQRQEERRAKALASAQEIDALASNAESLRWDAQRFKNAVNDVRWRAQRSRPGDHWLRSDLQRLVWALRDFARYSQNLEWRARSVLASAQKDPAAVPAAQRLTSASTWLRSECGWLEMDARSAGWDIRRAGYSMEAFDVENAARDAERAASDLEMLARQILAKVKS